MPYGSLENPHGAFGYPGGTQTTGAQPNIQGPYSGTIREFRNASTARTIPRGAALSWSTLSTLAGEVALSTILGDPLFCGIAITSCGLNTDRTTVTTAAGLGGIGTDRVQVQMEGPVYGALLTSGTVPGDFLWMSNTTVGAATTLGGGVLAPMAATVAATGLYGVAGIAFTSGTTGTTGFLTTFGPRGVVWVRPSIVGPVSTA